MLRFGLLLFTILLLAWHTGHAQTCDHTSGDNKRFTEMRISAPVKVKAFNGKTIETVYEDRLGLYAQSFEIDSKTVMPGTFSRDFKQGQWWIVFSSCDYYSYVIAPVAPGQIK